jgi:CCR4-NOT transcription complex subunit 1
VEIGKENKGGDNESSDQVFKSVNPDAPISDAPPPSQQIQDRIMFIINNLSVDNFQAKLDEMKSVYRPEYAPWLATYLVGKRVSIEPNYHGLYIRFVLVGMVAGENMLGHLLYETYNGIRALLESEKTVTSSEERSLLKNLGTWLGSITLARNIPIKRANLAVKDLLLEGYDAARLIVVIPFVCKVVEQGALGKGVFAPPNPWTMAILKVLSELYHFADLKLNLKFEIEVLCKHIKLDVKGISALFNVFRYPTH